MTKTKTTRTTCGACGRKITVWVYSRHTGKRFCFPGKGCNKPRKEKA